MERVTVRQQNKVNSELNLSGGGGKLLVNIGKGA